MSDLTDFSTKLTDANSVLVAIPNEPDKDTVAAALSLYLSLLVSGKSVSIVSSSQPVVRDSHLVGLDKVDTSVGGQNLVITINLPEDAVDKVTSNTEGGHLNLVLSPKTGGQPITQNDITYGSSGAAADLIVTVGAGSISDLGELADKEHTLFQKDNIANLSNKPGSFGSVNLTDPSSSNSELVTALLQELKLPLDPDIASNLMQGIEDATQGLSSPNMTADTFEALAVLYRSGARRSTGQPPSPQAKIVNDVPIVDVEAKESPKTELDQPVREGKKGAQPDWLKPKIFKGGNPARK